MALYAVYVLSDICVADIYNYLFIYLLKIAGMLRENDVRKNVSVSQPRSQSVLPSHRVGDIKKARSPGNEVERKHDAIKLSIRLSRIKFREISS